MKVPKKNSIRRVITSKLGVGTMMMMLSLLPIMIIVPAIALDFSIYTMTKAELQNALDSSAISALTKSTSDKNRADKMLKLVSTDIYEQNVIQFIEKNLNTTASGGGGTYTLVPGLPNTQHEATLTINCIPTSGGTEYVEGDALSLDHGYDYDFELTLEAQVDLPISTNVIRSFSLSDQDTGTASLTVTSNVRGLRLKGSEDFEVKNWEISQ